MAQNPHAVKVKEEASRLRKRLADARKEAAAQEAKAQEHQDTLAKLQADLDNITAGALLLASKAEILAGHHRIGRDFAFHPCSG